MNTAYSHPGSSLHSTLRLLRIEARRNAGLWIFPVILGVSWFLLDSQSWEPLLWEQTNRLLQYTVVSFAAPAIAGVTAWMAGRNRRRGAEELLSTTPYPDTTRRLTLWAATALWGVLAYAAFGAYMMIRTALGATWGGPALWPVAVVLAAILAHAAWGFFLGGLLPSRFTAPAVAVGALGLQQFLAGYSVPSPGGGSMSTWVNLLAAHNKAGASARWQALFYLGLTGVALAAIAVRRGGNVLPWVAVAGSALLAIGGVVMIWGEYPRYEPHSMVSHNNFGRSIPYIEETLPEFACKGSSVSVCVHPAYKPWLDETAAAATRFMAPLVGLPGAPARVELDSVYVRRSPTTGAEEADVSGMADQLVTEPDQLREGRELTEAQFALRTWLLRRVGQDSDCSDHMLEMSETIARPSGFAGPTRRTCEATDRFARLSPAEQRAWLEKNYAALRAGKLRLEDLP